MIIERVQYGIVLEMKMGDRKKEEVGWIFYGWMTKVDMWGTHKKDL